MVGMLTLWMACRTDSVVVAPPPPRHGQGFGALEAAVSRGDLETVKVLARDFSMGAVAEGPEADALGGALGFLMIADDPADLADAIATAKRACTDCHSRLGVSAGL